MAVGPLRAVLEAHLQATWNRSGKELGKVGAVTFALIMALVLVAAGGTVVVGSTLFGYVILGRRITEPAMFAPFLGGALAILALFGGVVGGITGGSRVLAWENYRVFPLRLRDLFLAELVAGLGDPLCLGMSLMTCFLLLGIALASPAVLPLVPLILGAMVATMLCLQHLLGSLAARAVKRLQVGLILLAILGWSTLYLVPAPTPASRTLRPAPAVELLLEQVKAAGGRLGSALHWLPSSQAALGLSEAARGQWGPALARQGSLLLSALLLLVLAARTLRREASPEALRVRPARPGFGRLWSFANPVTGLARLHLHNLLGSQLGRFSLLVPLMTLVLLRGPLSAAPSLQLWAVPAAFGYLSLAGIQFQLNQFGLDGAGVKVLLLLPLPSRELLIGKFWALAAYQGLQVLILLGLMLVLGDLLSFRSGAAAVCLAGCLFLVQVSVGHWTSAWLPRPMPRDSLKNSHQSPLVIWIGLGIGSTAASVFCGLYLVLAWLAPGWLLPLFILLLATAGWSYWQLVLPGAARYLERRREALAQALG